MNLQNKIKNIFKNKNFDIIKNSNIRKNKFIPTQKRKWLFLPYYNQFFIDIEDKFHFMEYGELKGKNWINLLKILFKFKSLKELFDFIEFKKIFKASKNNRKIKSNFDIDSLEEFEIQKYLILEIIHELSNKLAKLNDYYISQKYELDKIQDSEFKIQKEKNLIKEAEQFILLTNHLYNVLFKKDSIFCFKNNQTSFELKINREIKQYLMNHINLTKLIYPSNKEVEFEFLSLKTTISIIMKKNISFNNVSNFLKHKKEIIKMNKSIENLLKNIRTEVIFLN